MSLKIIQGKDDRVRFHSESADLGLLLKEEYDIVLEDSLRTSLVTILNQNETVSLIYNPDVRVISYNKSRKKDDVHVLTLSKMRKQPTEVVEQYVQRFTNFVNWLNLIISKEDA